MKFGTTYWGFLNSQRVVYELLDRPAAIYSSRIQLAMASDLMVGGVVGPLLRRIIINLLQFAPAPINRPTRAPPSLLSTFFHFSAMSYDISR